MILLLIFGVSSAINALLIQVRKVKGKDMTKLTIESDDTVAPQRMIKVAEDTNQIPLPLDVQMEIIDITESIQTFIDRMAGIGIQVQVEFSYSKEG